MFTNRDWNLSSLFQCGEEGSLIPRMFVETIASALGPAPLSGSSVNAYLETLFVRFAHGQQFGGFNFPEKQEK